MTASLKLFSVHALVACTLFSLHACQDDTLSVISQSDPTEYWYTRNRSLVEQSTMLRSHAVGFSYDVLGGEVCDVQSVRGQVLNLNALQNEGIYYVNTASKTTDSYYAAHSLSEAISKMNRSCNFSGDFLVYKRNAKKIAEVFEKKVTNTVLITQTRICQTALKEIDMDELTDRLSSDSDPMRFLSSSFQYAIQKLRNNHSTAVLDSFINIFGTHVVISAAIGGRCKLSITTTTSDIKTRTSEKEISSKSLDLFFYESNSTSTTETQSIFDGIIKSASLSLSVKGGDVRAFNELIADPYSANRDPSIMSTWIDGISASTSSDASAWNERLELADMEVSPIWNFIPDTEIAKLVQSRIEGSTPSMQELYGNRNFINATFPSSISSVSCKLGKDKLTFTNPYVVDVFAANRHVATLCREWVPEIDPDNAVTVAYPIYENCMQPDAGVCIHNGIAFNVRWLYNQFSIDTLATNCPDNSPLYLHTGYISTSPVLPIESYLSAKLAIGYEWPGSIGKDGSLQDTPYYETHRFLGNFYINSPNNFSNLPNWSYCTSSLYNDNYSSYLKGKGSAPYKISGLTVYSSDEKQYLNNRMVRNNDYTYFFNPTELSW